MIGIPVGFTYVQLPKDKPPQEIWPQLKWQDVSAAYAGVFFRVNGGGASTFGQVQGQSIPTMHIQTVWGAGPGVDSVDSYFHFDKWSDWFQTGDHKPQEPRRARFSWMSEELRPRNMAIRIWKRSG